ncbi:MULTISPECIES: aldo/keto reductase [Staphylococcus]|jgi:aryl-alcohol dehydrogenase-like predicted oxidoreductase|uniref:Aldo/keto reductase n=1 Tax=Staphylococcus nepalensis TaxID=214473 RepID=A0ABS3KX44_9STAP|nr:MULTISPECIES: aldo/keto reductase [Staphylococcus]MBO1204891.1 aldo/keto reductase [Staphylococcus nepalensis]MBO1213563.1 aldo/keto reductase [Staphylococcus nepalensis]MBO1215215.1 aldo/keto reductase [Staphylococcus nepalensis]MBO1220718.1 aldo/keto reductase [Staphylococcus nepalensis]MBO1225857.1 aldo/keto reductase [Staphylococcus nepalensis]
MDYTLLGHSGLTVSKYALGTIPFAGTNGFENAGGMTQETANYMVDYALEQGINQFDTANLYSKGESEITLGKTIRNKREEMIISSKTGVQLSENPNDGGATRINIEHSIDKTLKRLNTDYLDLYYVHLWDGQVPVEETIQVMNDLIKKGKIRYWGVSNYSGWALAKTHTLASANNMAPPIAQQIYYTPEAREAEYELLPAGKELGVGNSIWSPLGEGLLTGKINRTQSGEAGTRQGDGWPEPYIKNKALFYQLINVMQEIALNHNVSVAQVTLAWLRDRPNVDSIVLAARTKAQLKDNIASYHLQLANSEIEAISNLTTPEPIYPLWHRAMNAYDKASEAEKIYLSEYNKLMNDKNNLL